MSLAAVIWLLVNTLQAVPAFDPPYGYDGGGGYDIITLDLNGDGRLDLVSNVANTLQVLRGLGDGTFVLSAALPGVLNPISVAAGDLNGDGRPDLVCGGFFGSIWTFLQLSLIHI